jgi:hypothetical protein
LIVDHLNVGSMLFDPGWDASQPSLDVPNIIADHYAGNDRQLVMVVVIDLSN